MEPAACRARQNHDARTDGVLREHPPLSDELAALKDEGNGFFRAGDFLKAAGSYTKAIKVRRRPGRLFLSSFLFGVF